MYVCVRRSEFNFIMEYTKKIPINTKQEYDTTEKNSQQINLEEWIDLYIKIQSRPIKLGRMVKMWIETRADSIKPNSNQN